MTKNHEEEAADADDEAADADDEAADEDDVADAAAFAAAAPIGICNRFISLTMSCLSSCVSSSAKFAFSRSIDSRVN